MAINFPTSISLIPVFIGLAIVLAGVICFAKVSKVTGMLFSVIGVVFLALFGPMLFMDRIEVNSSGITHLTGFWFNQTRKSIEFEGLSLVSISEGRDIKNRPFELWTAVYQSGRRIEIDPGDLWETNGKSIIGYMNKQDITVIAE